MIGETWSSELEAAPIGERVLIHTVDSVLMAARIDTKTFMVNGFSKVAWPYVRHWMRIPAPPSSDVELQPNSVTVKPSPPF